MTVKGCKELTDAEQREVADLVRLHLETHPRRVGQLYNISTQRVRDIFRNHVTYHVLTTEALTALRHRMVQAAVPLHGANADVIVNAHGGG